MLIYAKFKHKTSDRLYCFNPENVLYIDEDGVLFAPDVYRLFASAEQYEGVMSQLCKHKAVDLTMYRSL